MYWFQYYIEVVPSYEYIRLYILYIICMEVHYINNLFRFIEILRKRTLSNCFLVDVNFIFIINIIHRVINFTPQLNTNLYIKVF